MFVGGFDHGVGEDDIALRDEMIDPWRIRTFYNIGSYAGILSAIVGDELAMTDVMGLQEPVPDPDNILEGYAGRILQGDPGSQNGPGRNCPG